MFNLACPTAGFRFKIAVNDTPPVQVVECGLYNTNSINGEFKGTHSIKKMYSICLVKLRIMIQDFRVILFGLFVEFLTY